MLAPWKLTIHDAQLDEFRQLRVIGEKVNNTILKDATFNLLAITSIHVTAQDVLSAIKKLIAEILFTT